MKKIAKYLFNISLLFIDTLVSVLSVLLFSSFSNIRKLKFIPVKGVDKCLILTNGVSLKRVLDSGEVNFFECDIFTVNLFYETNYFFDLKPANHVVTDNAFWDKTNKHETLVIATHGIEKKTGKTAGSRRLFINIQTKSIIRLHKPHPSSILKTYVILDVINILTKEELL